MEGKIKLATSPEVEKNHMNICEKVGDDYILELDADTSCLAEQLFAAGIVKNVIRRGQDVFIVINGEDLEKMDDPDYDVSG